jgi:phosphoglycolate phosphatase-like HAD superfamily hydrolase
VRPFSQVRELFQRIAQDGKPIVLATSGKESETKRYTKLLGIDDLIAGQTTADDAENSKPAPDILTAALEKLDDITASDVLVVGDTRFDLEAAGKGGFRALALLCGGTEERVLRKAGAIAVFRDPADLLSCYQQLMAKLQT